MYRVALTDAQRDGLHWRAHALGIPPRGWGRLDMIRLEGCRLGPAEARRSPADQREAGAPLSHGLSGRRL
jgi:hypothetical protein